MYLPKSPPGDTAPYDHAQRWFAHVANGRIGSGPGTTPAQLVQHLRNEEVLLGANHPQRSVRFVQRRGK